ncbi:MAG: RNase H family protein [Bryobacteraceae bacterium]
MGGPAPFAAVAYREPCEVEIATDSQYVLYGITKWIIKWKRRHWWRKHGPVRNADLGMELDELASRHKTTWVWTRGHAGHAYNTRCDWLAQNAAAAQRSSWADGRPHANLRLDLGASYVPPKPQAGLFEDVEPGGEDDGDDEGAAPKIG